MNARNEPMKETQRSDSSTERILGLLDLFTTDTPVWTVDALVEKENLARATMYRYVKALADTGFLVPVGGGGYSLGPRFIEIDRQIRRADPLLQVAPPIMRAQQEQVGGGQLLCRYYGERVLSIHREYTDERLPAMMSMERGRPFSLFLGAPSRIILANLPTHQLQRLFLYHADSIGAAGLGDSWIAFRDKMKSIRKAGYAVASDIDKSLIGVSAPIFAAPDVVTASLCMVRIRAEVDAAALQHLTDLAIASAAEISRQLQALYPPVSPAEAPAARARKKPSAAKTAPRAKARRA